MHGQEVKQGGLHNALEKGAWRLKLTSGAVAGLWRGGDEEERRDTGT